MLAARKFGFPEVPSIPMQQIIKEVLRGEREGSDLGPQAQAGGTVGGADGTSQPEAPAVTPVADSLEAPRADVVAEEPHPPVGGLPTICDGEVQRRSIQHPEQDDLAHEMVRIPEGGGDAIAICPECGGVAEDFVLDEVDIGVGIQTHVCNATFHDAAKESRR